MTPVEKVKAAIAEKFAPAIDFRAPYARVMLDAAARAAIEALRQDMREPSPGAIMELYVFSCGTEPAKEDECKEFWRSMIDDALGEKP